MSRRQIVSVAAVVVVIAAVVGTQVSTAPQTVTWITDFDKAAKQADQANKPIMVDLYTNWCHWCKKLDQTTFKDARVVKLSRDFVAAKVDAEKNAAIAKKYKVSGYPTILFLDSKGKEVSRVVGYQDANEFLKSMQAALKKAK